MSKVKILTMMNMNNETTPAAGTCTSELPYQEEP